MSNVHMTIRTESPLPVEEIPGMALIFLEHCNHSFFLHRNFLQWLFHEALVPYAPTFSACFQVVVMSLSSTSSGVVRPSPPLLRVLLEGINPVIGRKETPWLHCTKIQLGIREKMTTLSSSSVVLAGDSARVKAAIEEDAEYEELIPPENFAMIEKGLYRSA